MKVECIHGYFKFSEISPGELSQFTSLYSVDLARSGDHFTFEGLVDAPRYSLVGGTFLGIPTTVNFEGDPWEVMRQNRLVYHFGLGLIVPIDTITQVISLSQAGRYFVSSGMILPGSLTDAGSRVTDYSAFYVQDRANFKYSEIDYE